MPFKELTAPLKRFLKYNISSGIATIFDLSFLWVFTETFGIFYLLSASLAFLIGNFVNYLINMFWVFKSSRAKGFLGIFSFILVGISGLIITLGIMALFVEYFGLHYFFSRIIALVITIIWNYFLVSYAIFKQPVFK